MKKLRLYLPVVLWCGVIFYFSSLQSVPSPEDTFLNFILKKTAHILEYAMLYALTYHAANISERKNQNFFGPLLFVIFYASTDEFHQSFVLGRHARLYDVGLDTIGALFILWRKRARNPRDAREKI